MSTTKPQRYRLFRRSSLDESKTVADILRQETVGGVLLLIGAVVALVWANSPWSDSYHQLNEFKIGPAALHLDLSIGHWASDGLLAIFFFVVGLELKREFVAGDLRDPRRAAVPVIAAFAGVVVPAAIYVAVNFGNGEALRGWAIPTATDIAFAVAVLAVIGRHLPSALRTFLLTLAVVDDLIAILIIAVVYTEEVNIGALLLALIPLAAFTVAVQFRVRSWWLLIPLAITTWALVHASGIHATVAGVLLGFAVPARKRDDEDVCLAAHFEHRWRPVSSGVAVPIFALFAAGVTIGGLAGFGEALVDPVVIGIVAGLVLGKLIGIFGSTYLMGRFTRADVGSGLAWIDVAGVALLGGIGFTVSLLVGDLSFESGSEHEEHVKIGVLTASLLAALLAMVILRVRNKVYREIYESETRDADADGIPDIYQIGEEAEAYADAGEAAAPDAVPDEKR